ARGAECRATIINGRGRLQRFDRPPPGPRAGRPGLAPDHEVVEFPYNFAELSGKARPRKLRASGHAATIRPQQTALTGRDPHNEPSVYPMSQDAQTKQRCLIIGASHAAAQLAPALRNNGWQGTIGVLGNEYSLPYHRPPLSKDFLSGKKSLDDILIQDRKSTRLNSSHVKISYAVFCL